MKKIMTLLAMTAAILAVSCNKDPKKDKTPDEEEPEYEAPIVVDGDTADWAKLDASKVQSCTLKAADTWAYPEIKSAKVYADELYVYVYVEFNKAVLEPTGDSHFALYINGDNNTATGGYSGQWDQGETPCIDVLVMGTYFTADDGYIQNLDCEVYNWTGENNADGWSWGDVEITGFAEGACNSKGMEFALARDFYPAGTWADEFTIGFQLQTNGWDATGALPNGEPSDDNPSGKAPLLKVVVNK